MFHIQSGFCHLTRSLSLSPVSSFLNFPTEHIFLAQPAKLCQIQDEWHANTKKRAQITHKKRTALTFYTVAFFYRRNHRPCCRSFRYPSNKILNMCAELNGASAKVIRFPPESNDKQSDCWCCYKGTKSVNEKTRRRKKKERTNIRLKTLYAIIAMSTRHNGDGWRMLNVECSMHDARCLMLDAQCSMLLQDVRCVAHIHAQTYISLALFVFHNLIYWNCSFFITLFIYWQTHSLHRHFINTNLQAKANAKASARFLVFHIFTILP